MNDPVKIYQLQMKLWVKWIGFLFCGLSGLFVLITGITKFDPPSTLNIIMGLVGLTLSFTIFSPFWKRQRHLELYENKIVYKAYKNYEVHLKDIIKVNLQHMQYDKIMIIKSKETTIRIPVSHFYSSKEFDEFYLTLKKFT